MIELNAPAKLTTSLRITGVRDDGFHLLDAEMVSLDLADSVAVTEGPSTTVSYAGLYAPSGPMHDDLVARALNLVGRRAAVTVTKRIPAGGGLGGGSSDAAAILRWAGYDDLVGAAGLGADVAFCLVGGRARVGGIGEKLDPLDYLAQTYTFLLPPFGCSTPAVYREWDAMGGPVGDNGNDLEPAALQVEPRLAQWRDLLGHATGRTPRLAGSGSSWFVEGSFPGDGRLVARTIPVTK